MVQLCYGVVHVSISFTLAHLKVSDPVHGLLAQGSKRYFTTFAMLLVGLMVLWGGCVQGSNPLLGEIVQTASTIMHEWRNEVKPKE